MTAATRMNLTTVRWLLLALAAWSVLAAIPTSSAYIADGSHGLGRWLWFFANVAPWYYLWAIATPFIYRVSISWLHPDNGWLPAIAGHACIAFVLSTAFGFVVQFDNWRAWLLGDIAPGYYTMSGFSYLFILLGIHLYSLHQRVRAQDTLLAEQKAQALRLEADLARSQVELLRGQMNPHFLFNALNCIGALIETGRNERAYEALEDLGSLLRTSLEHRHHERVSLSEELEFAKRYIAMEQVRFGERLTIDISVDSAAARWQVPPFMLQPLIENSVKHAVAPSHAPVTITVRSRRTAGGIEVLVADNGGGPQRNAGSSGTGVGLENLRKRLELIYGSRARLDFGQDETGTRVTLYLPDDDPHSTTKTTHSDIEDQRDPVSLLRRTRGAEI